MAMFLAFGLVLPSCQGETGTARPDRPSTDKTPSGPPNIIFILADDLDARSVEYMPKLKSLLTEQGTTFENAYATHSLCCPSRASILRGQYTHNHQVLTNGGGPYYTNSNQTPKVQGLQGFEKFHEMGHAESTIATWL